MDKLIAVRLNHRKNNGLFVLLLCNFVKKSCFSVCDVEAILPPLFVGVFTFMLEELVHGEYCALTFGSSEVNVAELQIGDILDWRRHQPFVIFWGTWSVISNSNSCFHPVKYCTHMRTGLS